MSWSVQIVDILIVLELLHGPWKGSHAEVAVIIAVVKSLSRGQNMQNFNCRQNFCGTT